MQKGGLPFAVLTIDGRFGLLAGGARTPRAYTFYDLSIV